jgi:phage terminase large subunit-like protein
LKSRFDNTFLTYGTDYGLALAMMVSAYAIAVKKKTSSSSCNNNNNNNKKNDSFSSSSSSSQQQQQQQQQQLVLLQQQHIFYSRAMLLTYMLSVLAGGIAHQYFTTLQSRNHTAGAFRFLWTVCVGSVTAASGFMGSIGAVWARYDGQQEQRRRRVVVVVLNEQFWMAYAVVVTAVVVAGGWSYQRPAADIFVAGITQFPSTFYIMYLLYTGLPTLRLSKAWRYAGLVAFIANAPLLPAYPLLCVYATQHLSLGQVNLILHSNLLLAWCGQGRVLRAVTAAWEVSWGIPPPAAVPVKKLCKAY